MIEAFKAANLDPRDPAHIEILLRVLASAVFEGPSAGRKKGSVAWDLGREVQLALNEQRVRHSHPEGEKLSDAQVSKILSDLPEYEGVTHGTTRKRLPSARKTLDWFKQGVALGALKRPVGK